MKKFFLSVFIFLAVQCWAQKEETKYEFINIREGMSKVGVSSIIQDQYGFIWITTEGAGLYKFDGTEYTSYQHKLNDPNTLSSSRVKYAYRDRKNRLWIGTENGLNLYDRNLNQFKRIALNKENPYNDFVLSIQEDAAHNLLIGTNGFGLFTLQPETLEVEKVLNSTVNDANQPIIINNIKLTKQGKAFVATNFGLKEVDTKNNKLIDSRLFINEKKSFDFSIESLFLDNKDNLWIGASNHEGTYRCVLSDDGNNNILSIKHLSFSSKKIMTIAQLPDNTMMIGAENDGLFHLDTTDSVLKNYVSNSTEENSILHNSIWELFVDKDKRLWVGYYNKGVAVSDNLYDKFSDIKSIPNSTNSLKTSSVTGIIKDDAHNLWIATDGGGIDVYNLNTTNITHINRTDTSSYTGLTSDYIITLKKDSKGNIWAGSWDGGLYFLKKGSTKFTNYNTTNTQGNLKTNTIQSFSEDSKGLIWIAAFLDGIQSFNPKTKEFKEYDLSTFLGKNFVNVQVRKVLVDTNDNLWIGTADGLYFAKRIGGEIKEVIAIRNSTKEEYSASSDANYILTIYQDSFENIWIGTRGGGLCKFDKKTNSFIWYNETNGLLEKNIAAIIEDDKNNLWLSGNAGLTKMNPSPSALEFTNYTANDGLLSNDFNFGAALKDTDGTLYFGNLKGVDYFNPDKIKINTRIPELQLTGFKLFNEDVIPLEDKSPLTKVIAETDSITLSSTQSVFTIEYTGINFTRPEENSYAYYLEGYETSWNYVDQKRSATYTNLDHGTYIFKLKAANNDGIWSTAPIELVVTILPPWWRTKSAILLYILFFIVGLYLLNYLTQRRIVEKELLRNERLVQVQNEELSKKQLQFFTNISHEFRTPLTLIINPLKDIINNKELDLPEEIKNKHAVIYKNTDRLYRLINELMDLRKLQLNKMKVRAEKINLIDFSKDIACYFKEETSTKNILLSVDADIHNIEVWADPKMLEKIIFNLLSNAVKATPNGGAINIELRATDELYDLPACDAEKPVKAIEILISDTGEGLDQSQTEKIFERFYQVEGQNKAYIGGTGIGLEVVKSFVSLHKGKIDLESKVGEGTTFKIILPVGNSHFKENEILLNTASKYKNKVDFLLVNPVLQTSQEKDKKEVSKSKTVLIVEDNIELQDYLKNELLKEYKVLTANNGKEGYKIAQETFPDVIITDVIMPEMDGFELCDLIKTNTTTSHLPILMLTAKASIENRIEGIEKGADAYMVKPFDINLLKLRLSQLIKSRQLIFDKYFSSISGSEDIANSDSVDKDFIQKLLNYINDNISDPNLSVEELAAQLFLSRSQLYRKIKAITGQTVNEFIRKIRLERAKKILENGSSNISEACFSVGFSSPSYFSKCFKAHFGVLPSEIIVQSEIN